MDQKFEKEWIKTYFEKNCKNYQDFCSLDLEGLNDPWVNEETLSSAVCAFRPLVDTWSTEEELPKLTFEFDIHKTGLTDRIYRVDLHGVKYLMKEEEYARYSDTTLHEYFVGLQLNQLKDRCPIFAGMIGAFGCTPDDCKYQGDDSSNVNFVLYQYIPGETLWNMRGKIGLNEIWNMVLMVYEGVNFANEKIGFIHQDLHFTNIICYPLGKLYNIRINGKNFVSRYLPIVIDFARSKVIVEGKVLSPVIKFLRMPAMSTDFDLSYLLFSFASLIGELDVFPKGYQMGNGIRKSDLERIFNLFNEEYGPGSGNLEKIPDDNLTISTKLPEKKYENCPEKPLDPEPNTHRHRTQFLRALQRKDELAVKIDEDDIKDTNSFEEYLDLVIKYDLPLTWKGENNIVKKFPSQPTFIKELSTMIDSYDKGNPVWDKYFEDLKAFAVKNYPGRQLGTKIKQYLELKKDDKFFDK